MSTPALGSTARALDLRTRLVLVWLLTAASALVLSACTDPSTDHSGHSDGGVQGPRDRDAAGLQDGATSADAAPTTGRDASPSSTDASTTLDANVDASTAAADDAAVGGGTVPTFVAVGYAGLRIVSYDLGLTWAHAQYLGPLADDPDNSDNLRAITFAHGLFVATGHRILTSPDGRTWTERDHPMMPAQNGQGGQWLGGVAHGNGRFVASGGYGYSVRSIDGLTWTQAGDRSDEHMRSLAFGNGVFMGGTDADAWWTTTDGTDWAFHSDERNRNLLFCDDMFRNIEDCPFGATGAGVRIWGGDGDGLMYRLVEPGDDADAAAVDANYIGVVNAVAFGYTNGP